MHVKLHVPLCDVDDPSATPLQGYYVTFGIRAVPRRVHQVIAETIQDGAVDWSETVWELVEPDSLDKVVRDRITDVNGEGVRLET